MAIIYKKGNVVDAFIDGKFNIFAHGCNCKGVMGAGVAREVSKNIPDLRNAYFTDTRGHELGKFSYAVLGPVSDKRVGFNLYTQQEYGRVPGYRYVSYPAISSCFHEMITFLRVLGIQPEESDIGIPKIGAGLGGGEWGKIEQIISYFVPSVRNIFVYEL